MPIRADVNLRRTDLCTCGKGKGDAVHRLSGVPPHVTTPLGWHAFVPHPQPPALPNPAPFQHAGVAKVGGVWIAEVFAGDKKGRGQAATWADAMNAAIEDLKEKSGSILG